MTVSRRLVPGQLHAATRRTLERRKFLNPRPGVRELLGYALGRALQLTQGLPLHTYVGSTNHEHAVLTDRPPEGDASVLPAFFRDFHGLVGRAMNARLGRGGPFWTTGGPDNVELWGQLTIEQQLLYAWTNPVKDGLCERPEDWAEAGLMFLPEDWGRTFTFRKPEGAFFGGRRPAGLSPTDPDALADWQAALREEAREALARGVARDR
ncbi:MAG: transposase, partial [Myxococcota bacterium]